MTSMKLAGLRDRAPRFDPVVAVVLAAGASDHQGSPQQHPRVRRRTLLERAVRAAHACDAVIVVVGADAAAVRSEAEAANMQVTFATNLSWASSAASSFHVGLDAALAVAPDLAAVTFIAGGQPSVERDHVELLLLAFRAGVAPIAASGYAKDRRAIVGLPVLFGRSVFDELRGLSGDCDARMVVAQDASRVATVPACAAEADIENDRSAQPAE